MKDGLLISHITYYRDAIYNALVASSTMHGLDRMATSSIGYLYLVDVSLYRYLLDQAAFSGRTEQWVQALVVEAERKGASYVAVTLIAHVPF